MANPNPPAAVVPQDEREFRPYKEFLKEYRVGRVLGKGSFGVVRKCKHKKSKSTFAVKTIDAENHRDEASISLNLQHEHIITCHGAFKDEKTHTIHLVLDYCLGGHAQEHMDELTFGYASSDEVSIAFSNLGLDSNHYCQPPPVKDVEHHAGTIISQLLSAVQYCHDVAGVVHRDIKPANVLIRDRWYEGRDEPFVQLIDFGLARYLDRKTTRVGTVAYAAPEVISGSTSADPRAADIWSIGVVAYSLLYGRPPFVGKQDEDTKVMVCQAPLQFPESPAICEQAKDFVSMLLNRDPSRRPTAKIALQHGWLRPYMGNHATTEEPMVESPEYCSSTFGSTASAEFAVEKSESKPSQTKSSKSGLFKTLFKRRQNKSTAATTTEQSAASPLATQ